MVQRKTREIRSAGPTYVLLLLGEIKKEREREKRKKGDDGASFRHTAGGSLFPVTSIVEP